MRRKQETPAERPGERAVERSIAAFEQIHGLNVKIHDLAENLSPFLRRDRIWDPAPRRHPLGSPGSREAPLEFKLERFRPDLAGLQGGRIRVGRAGAVEWVLPVFQNDKLFWVIFAGPRRERVEGGSRARARGSPDKSSRERTEDLSRGDGEDEERLIMEHLRQLAAFLQLWIEEAKPIQAEKKKSPAGLASIPAATRQLAVLRFIDETYAEPVTLGMLARRLHLSEGRASHVVRECCHASFRDLLLQKRLRVAMELLRQSGMSVSEVAASSGFENVAHFYRLFRRRVGHTPAQHRTNGQS